MRTELRGLGLFSLTYYVLKKKNADHRSWTLGEIIFAFINRPSRELLARRQWQLSEAYQAISVHQ